MVAPVRTAKGAVVGHPYRPPGGGAATRKSTETQIPRGGPVVATPAAAGAEAVQDRQDDPEGAAHIPEGVALCKSSGGLLLGGGVATSA